MPSINMIAARRAERKRLEKQIRIVALILFCEILFAVGVFSFMTARIHASNVKLAELNNDLKRIQPTVDRIQYYEREIKKLEPRLDLLAESREQTLLWYTVLQDLARSVPQSTWLCSVTTTKPAPTSGSEGQSEQAKKENTPTMKLKGTSASQRLVGETMLRLNRFPEFSKVDLSYTQKANSNEYEGLEFEIAAIINAYNSDKGGRVTNVKN
ncbi:MAG: PilN domain-containing protein [Armatimonadota bacterium]|nr:PilN domain-containing protein [Armatimonadota bacterium]